MSAVAIGHPVPGGLRRPAPTGRGGVALPPLSPRLGLARATLVVVFVLSTSLLVDLVVVSALEQRAAQQRAFQRLRGELAQGTGPVGPADGNGRQLRPGSPVAYLEIPAIGLRQVVVEGTTAGSLFTGPGHRRDTPLPGQAGVSVVFGRRAAYGGPFARIHDLRPGAIIHVTTGEGAYDYQVTGVRRAGDPVPAPVSPGGGRLLLATADGRPFMPSGVLRVDADLKVPAAAGPARLVSSSELPASEQMLGADTSTLWALALWLQGLIALVLGAVWAWHRWGRAQGWVVLTPPLLLVGLCVSGEAARLFPNLL